ncbi:MAG: Fic family protein [Acutalibacteraceae bacterium]
MLEATDFINVINDPNFYSLKKMKNKYGKSNIDDVIKILKFTFYKYLPICDFKNNNLAYAPSLVNIKDDAYKILISSGIDKNYSAEKMETEIHSTLKIENISSDRNSIRNIIEGADPKNDDENKIYGIKKGLDFISVKSNSITEENLHRLYSQAIEFYLKNENKLLKGNYYRHDSVYVVGNKISHCGLPHHLLSDYMKKFIDFINKKDEINILEKSAIIHFYFAYIHPYFDGNGRMARLVQLWYLIQNGFNSALQVSFSNLISNTKNEYYKTFEIIEENVQTLDLIDVTPFVGYFNKNIFSKLNASNPEILTFSSKINSLISDEQITFKEKELFSYVVSHYGNKEFSTKKLEKDFGNAAYATIRSFVIKFTKFGIFSCIKYCGNRNKYKLI